MCSFPLGLQTTQLFLDMGTATCISASSPSLFRITTNYNYSKSSLQFTTLRKRSRSLTVVSAVKDPIQADITWQIIVGSIAGVVPFVVAGVEFSKRIIAQRRCEECGGSGLVLIDKDYYKCPQCGGFLPWQSWKRFFTG